MHIKFRDYAESLHPKFESLMSMSPIHICDLAKELPPLSETKSNIETEMDVTEFAIIPLAARPPWELELGSTF